MQKELGAEFVGTFTLVTAVCGAALFSAPSAGLIAVAFAVGLSVFLLAVAVETVRHALRPAAPDATDAPDAPAPDTEAHDG